MSKIFSLAVRKAKRGEQDCKGYALDHVFSKLEDEEPLNEQEIEFLRWCISGSKPIGRPPKQIDESFRIALDLHELVNQGMSATGACHYYAELKKGVSDYRDLERNYLKIYNDLKEVLPKGE